MSQFEFFEKRKRPTDITTSSILNYSFHHNHVLSCKSFVQVLIEALCLSTIVNMATTSDLLYLFHARQAPQQGSSFFFILFFFFFFLLLSSSFFFFLLLSSSSSSSVSCPSSSATSSASISFGSVCLQPAPLDERGGQRRGPRPSDVPGYLLLLFGKTAVTAEPSQRRGVRRQTETASKERRRRDGPRETETDKDRERERERERDTHNNDLLQRKKKQERRVVLLGCFEKKNEKKNL